MFAQASPRSVGGVSLFEGGAQINEETAVNFASEENVIRAAASQLQTAGFDVLQVSQTTINIAGPASLYERVFGTTLVPEERDVIKEGGKQDTATFVECPDTDMPGFIDTSNSGFDLLEGVAIEEPRYFHQNPFAPMTPYWHLRVPGDVSMGMNADRAHRSGISGRGIKVVMCDSGWFAHPHFTNRGYRSSPVVLGPGAANAAADEVGHGTGESANLFAVAPDIDFTMVKISFVNSIGAFNAAVALSPHIISNSWGSDKPNFLTAADQALAAAISLAVASGIIVVFSAGNGQWGFPGQHPDVISAGGVTMLADMSMRATDYASGFASNIYPGRRVPDVSGLVGTLPHAMYIMLPLQPGDQIDIDYAGGVFPNGDQTANNDGWAAFSGTSAAAPMVAGICALMKQACPKLSPAVVRSILRSTARDVTVGTGSANTGSNAAGPGYDFATGYGLADANKAVLVAKIRCLGPIIGPPIVLPPILPPVLTPTPPPIVPPIGPPIRPPIVPPIGPPIRPPIGPSPEGPVPAGTEGQGAAPQASPLSEVDVTELERLVNEEDFDVDI